MFGRVYGNGSDGSNGRGTNRRPEGLDGRRAPRAALRCCRTPKLHAEDLQQIRKRRDVHALTTERVGVGPSLVPHVAATVAAAVEPARRLHGYLNLRGCSTF